MRSHCVLIAACLVLTGCMGFNELPVEYDYSYKGNFKKYRTFELTVNNSPSDTSRLDGLIEKNIVSRMKFLGYKETDRKPHLLILYKMFPDSLIFNGYVQPDIEQWVKSQDELEYNPKKVDMKTGTLLIQFFDKRQNRSIWQGYTTATYSTINFNDQRNIRNAVVSILEKYRFWAEGFIEGDAYKAKEINN